MKSRISSKSSQFTSLGFRNTRLSRALAVGTLSGSLALSAFGCKSAETPAAATESAGAATAEATAAAPAAAAGVAGTATGAAPAATAAAAAATPPAAAAAPLTASVPLELATRIPAGAAAVAFVDVSAIRAAAATAANLNPAEFDAAADAQIKQQLQSMGITLPAGASFKVSELRGFAIAGWEDESVVLVTNASALTGALTDGAEPVAWGTDGTMAAIRGDKLVLGSGAKFAEAVAPQIGQAFDPAKAWAELWPQVSANSVLSLIVPNFASMANDPGTNELKAMGLNRAAISVKATGEANVWLDVANDENVRRGLGSMQKGLADQLAALKMQAPPFAAGWVTYLELVTNGLWSRVSLSREGTLSKISLAAPTCGSPLNNVVPLIALAALSDSAKTDPTAPMFQPVTQRVAAACATIPGPDASLPRGLVAMAGPELVGQRAVVLADVGNVLRVNLPTFFGLLPFALEPGDVSTALGPNPLGMAGISDPNGKLAIYMYDNGAGVVDYTAVMPAGVKTTLPIPVQPGNFAEVLPELGYVLGTAGSDARAKATADPNSPWTKLVNALPANASVAFILPSEQLTSTYAQLTAELPELANAKLVAVTLSSNFQFGVHVFVEGDANAAAATIKASLDRAMKKLTDAAAGGQALGVSEGFTKNLTVSVPAPGVISLLTPTSNSPGATGLGAIGAALLPMMANGF